MTCFLGGEEFANGEVGELELDGIRNISVVVSFAVLVSVVLDVEVHQNEDGEGDEDIVLSNDAHQDERQNTSHETEPLVVVGECWSPVWKLKNIIEEHNHVEGDVGDEDEHADEWGDSVNTSDHGESKDDE